MARVSAGGVWLIYAALSNVQFPDQSDSLRLMRQPLAGGPPQLVFATKSTNLNFDCPYRSGAPCFVSELSSDAKRLILESFDPSDGRRRTLFSVVAPTEKPINWTISPDGSRIAMTGVDPEGGIEVRSLAGEVERRIEIKDWPNPLAVDWSADGTSLWVSHFGLIASPSGPIGATLLRVDLDGHAQPLWETRGGRYTWGISSPDGRYLAIRGAASERNAWMIENF
jgi:Tol biopolymer transport system component